MQVAKWGNSLAVRLPAAVVEALKLKQGDQVQIRRRPGIPTEARSEPRLRRLRRRLPPALLSAAKRPMNDKALFDTNVLVYAIGQRDSQTARAEVLLAGGGVVSVHVLNELVLVARRKLGFSWKEVHGPSTRSGRSADHRSRSRRTKRRNALLCATDATLRCAGGRGGVGERLHHAVFRRPPRRPSH